MAGNGTIKGRVQHAMFTAASLAAVNPVLLEGEVVYESDSRKRKVGNGVNTWNNLPYESAGELPASIPASKIEQSPSYRMVSDFQTTAWNDKANNDLGNVTLSKWLTGSASGYYKAPDGLLIQWGRTSGGIVNQSITFPLAFYSTPCSVVAVPFSDTTDHLTVRVLSIYPSYFTASASWISPQNIGGATSGICWIAMGRWK